MRSSTKAHCGMFTAAKFQIVTGPSHFLDPADRKSLFEAVPTFPLPYLLLVRGVHRLHHEQTLEDLATQIDCNKA